MRAYLCLIIGGLWLALALAFHFRRTGFGIELRRGNLDAVTRAIIFRIAVSVIVLGWIVPTAVGLLFLWMKKHS
jgi:hypothetical protein